MPKRRITAKQKAASRRNLEKARRLRNKAKIQYTRGKALEVLRTERGTVLGTQSDEKAFVKWKTFHMASKGIKPTGKRLK